MMNDVTEQCERLAEEAPEEDLTDIVMYWAGIEAFAHSKCMQARSLYSMGDAAAHHPQRS